MRWKLLTWILIFFAGAVFTSRWILNNLDNLGYLSSSNQLNLSGSKSQSSETCRQTWLRTVNSISKTSSDGSESDIETILACDPAYVSLLNAIMPLNITFALRAINHFPNNAEAWFWLGEASSPVDPIMAQSAYSQTVTISPHHPLAWCRLGKEYDSNGEIQNALEAFLACCNIADAGSNGCYGAGRMAEKLGDPQKAIEYYRFSRWDGALKRADELEEELNTGY